MERLNSIKDFFALRDRLMSATDPAVPTIIIPAGTCGQARGANDLIEATKQYLSENGLADRIHLRVTGCHGFCEMEASVLVEPDRTFYPQLRAEDMPRIIDSVLEGTVAEDLLYKDPKTGKPIPCQDDIPFFAKQTRTILANNERMDPVSIEDYIRIGGYSQIAKALHEMTPEQAIEEVKTSGLRGRGGAGFPTAFKWAMLADRPGEDGKYLVCNADEGNPGAYMDRTILEGNPHSIYEGMLIGAYATGADRGVIYIRAEYPVAIKHLNIALQQARELGLLGDNILGTEFSFDVQIVKGAGAYVCGEEIALISSIEGGMGEPRQRPPYPVQKGIFGRPTVINNVETWANIPIIIRDGGANYASVGTANNTGTKILSLVGKVKNSGLVEIPMGMSISEVVYDIGGGPVGESRIKAMQTGGPSGGCIPEERFDLPIDFDTLSKAGWVLGSGGVIILDETSCIVDLTKHVMAFLKDESCGKCYTCRKGTQRMYELLDDITNGTARPEHLDLLEELAVVVKDTTMCGLGQTAPIPVLSSIRDFRDEYERHIHNKKCDANVCTLQADPASQTPVGGAS